MAANTSSPSNGTSDPRGKTCAWNKINLRQTDADKDGARVLSNDRTDPDLLKTPSTRSTPRMEPSNADGNSTKVSPEVVGDLLEPTPTPSTTSTDTFDRSNADENSARAFLNSTIDPEKCYFTLKLPAEIRDHIYDMVFSRNEECDFIRTEPPSNDFCLANRQIARESHAMYMAKYRAFWTDTHFTMTVPGPPPSGPVVNVHVRYNWMTPQNALLALRYKLYLTPSADLARIRHFEFRKGATRFIWQRPGAWRASGGDGDVTFMSRSVRDILPSSVTSRPPPPPHNRVRVYFGTEVVLVTRSRWEGLRRRWRAGHTDVLTSAEIWEAAQCLMGPLDRRSEGSRRKIARR